MYVWMNDIQLQKSSYVLHKLWPKQQKLPITQITFHHANCNGLEMLALPVQRRFLWHFRWFYHRLPLNGLEALNASILSKLPAVYLIFLELPWLWLRQIVSHWKWLRLLVLWLVALDPLSVGQLFLNLAEGHQDFLKEKWNVSVNEKETLQGTFVSLNRSLSANVVCLFVCLFVCGSA